MAWSDVEARTSYAIGIRSATVCDSDVTVVVITLSPLTVFTGGYIFFSPNCRHTCPPFTMEAFSDLWAFFKLTVSSAVMLCVRIGNELGARHPRVAKLSVFVVVSGSLIISIILSGIVLIFRVLLSKLNTSSEEVIQAVIDLTPLLAFSIFLNGIQPILSGVAIGNGWQEIVAYVNVGAYYFIGLPVGCVLGFKTSLGVAGIWWGLIVGVFVQTVCLIIITARTDWSKEVVRAASKRLKSASDVENLVTFGMAE